MAIDLPTEAPATPDTASVGAVDPPLAPQPLVQDELLVEEISIDGMCGVY